MTSWLPNLTSPVIFSKVAKKCRINPAKIHGDPPITSAAISEDSRERGLRQPRTSNGEGDGPSWRLPGSRAVDPRLRQIQHTTSSRPKKSEAIDAGY